MEETTKEMNNQGLNIISPGMFVTNWMNEDCDVKVYKVGEKFIVMKLSYFFGMKFF